MSPLYDWYYQLFHKPKLPDTSFEGQTVLITGTNTGIGKEAARHLVKLGAKRVIATARSTSRGAQAITDIEDSTRDHPGTIELWELDYGSWDSIQAFSERLRAEFAGPHSAQRLDAVCLNAGRATETWGTMDDGNEECIMVNCLATGFLMCVLFPILQDSARERAKNLSPGLDRPPPVLCITGSGIAALASFKEKKKKNRIFEALKDEKLANMRDRYPTSKLIQIMLVREMANHFASTKPFVTVNSVSPGLVATDLARSAEGITKFLTSALGPSVAWSPEEGSRTIIHALSLGPESHGKLVSSLKVDNNTLGAWIGSDEGRETQRRVFDEALEIWEGKMRGVTGFMYE